MSICTSMGTSICVLMGMSIWWSSDLYVGRSTDWSTHLSNIIVDIVEVVEMLEVVVKGLVKGGTEKTRGMTKSGKLGTREIGEMGFMEEGQ